MRIQGDLLIHLSLYLFFSPDKETLNYLLLIFFLFSLYKSFIYFKTLFFWYYDATKVEGYIYIYIKTENE